MSDIGRNLGLCDDHSMPTPDAAEPCKQPDPPTDKDVQENLRVIMDKMNIPACLRADGSVYVRPPKPLGPPTDRTHTSSLSCEALLDITRSYLAAKSSVTCLVRRIAQCSSETTTISNSIVVNNGPNGVIDCRCRSGACTETGLNLSNFASAQLISKNTTASSVVTEVARDAMMDFMEELLKKMLSSNPDGFPDTPDGARRVEQVREAISLYLSQTDWTDVVQKSVTSIYAENTIKVFNEGLIKADSCNLSNTVIASLVADKVILLSLDGALGLDETKGYLRAMSDHDKETFPIKTNWLPIVLGVVGGVVLLGVVIFLVVRKLKSRAAKKKSSALN